MLLDELREKTYYEVLGVGCAASQMEIVEAYHRLARQHDPDVACGPDASDELVTEEELLIFELIESAYQTLSDRQLRQEYDSELTVGEDSLTSDNKTRIDEDSSNCDQQPEEQLEQTQLMTDLAFLEDLFGPCADLNLEKHENREQIVETVHNLQQTLEQASLTSCPAAQTQILENLSALHQAIADHPGIDHPQSRQERVLEHITNMRQLFQEQQVPPVAVPEPMTETPCNLIDSSDHHSTPPVQTTSPGGGPSLMAGIGTATSVNDTFAGLPRGRTGTATHTAVQQQLRPRQPRGFHLAQEHEPLDHLLLFLACGLPALTLLGVGMYYLLR